MHRARGAVQVAIAACLWGTWSLYLRPTGLPGTVTAPIVLLVLGASAFALIRVENKTPVWDRRAIRLLLLYAVLEAINAGTFFAAMQVTTVAVAVLTHSVAPLLVALLAPRVDGVRVKGSVAAAMAGLAGLVLLLRPWERADGSVWLGAALGLTSALAYAAIVFVVSPLAARVGVMRATSYHAVLAAALFLPFAVPHAGAVDAGDVGLLAIGALLSGTLAAGLFIDGLARIGSARAAVLALIEPTVAVIVGWLAWDEPLGARALFGGAIVVGASAYVAIAPRA